MKKHLMAFRIDTSLHRSLRKLAKDESRTIQHIITRAIASELDRAGIEDSLPHVQNNPLAPGYTHE